jgi:hypothetical protein
VTGYLYVKLLRFILFHPSRPELAEIKELIDSILRMEQVTPELRLAVEQGYTNQTRNVTGKSKGWVLHGLYCCIWALFNCTTVEQAIAKIVAMGDTKRYLFSKPEGEQSSLTPAKIAAAVMGVYYGLDLDNPITVANPYNTELHDLANLIGKLIQLNFFA